VVKSPADVRKSIGYVAQDVGIDEHATGRENLTLYGHFYRLDNKTIKQRIKEIFELVDLIGYEDKMVSSYSGGMRKRLDIAMGLIHQPKIIFLDEPTVGLDPQTRAHIWDYIRKLAKSMNVTIFLTTHYMEEADQLADRVAIIDLGKIITSGTPDELKRSIGGDVVTLSPCVVKTEECQEFLQRTKSVLSNKPFIVGMQEADTTLAVYVQNGESAAPNIMRILDSEGIEVQTLSVSRPSLNDVFLKYTGRNIRPQEGAPTTYTEVARRRSRRQ
jgi:ABC-2 type transport system ATP-binding protein